MLAPTQCVLGAYPKQWTLYTDGLADEQGCGAGILLTTPNRSHQEYALCFKFHASNNRGEYEALIVDLLLAKSIEVLSICVLIDS